MSRQALQQNSNRILQTRLRNDVASVSCGKRRDERGCEQDTLSNDVNWL